MLTRTFGRESIWQYGASPVCAVNDVSLTIKEGEVLGIVGESGSGKTTLARLMAHLDKPNSGTISYRGKPTSTYGRQEWREFRGRVQIVFQDPHSALDPMMTVYASIAEGLRSSRLSRSAMRKRVGELMNMVGLSPEQMDRLPREFSGGQKQRIVLARALAPGPELLILDEPVSALDVSVQAQIVNLLMSLKQTLNITLVFISHDLNLVAYASDRIGVMRDGEIVEIAPAETLLASPENPYTVSLFRDAPSFIENGATIDAHPRRNK